MPQETVGSVQKVRDYAIQVIDNMLGIGVREGKTSPVLLQEAAQRLILIFRPGL